MKKGKKFLYASIYVLGLGILSNFVAKEIPVSWKPDRFPFALWPWEKNGKLFRALQVRKWKDWMPDMSRILPFLPEKEMQTDTSGQHVQQLVQETCKAECVHAALIVCSFGILTFWRDRWAALFLAVYNLLGNVPFIIIQRFNRPRLVRLAKRKSGKLRLV